MNTVIQEPRNTLEPGNAALLGQEIASTQKTLAGPRYGIRSSLVVLATIAVVWVLQWGGGFFIPLAVAVFITFWLMPLVDRLEKLRINRVIGAALVLGALLAAIGGTFYALRDDATEFIGTLPKATRHAIRTLNKATQDPNGWLHNVRVALNDKPLARTTTPIAPGQVDMQTFIVRGSTTAMAAAANVGIGLFLIYLLLVSGDLFKRKLIVVISGHLSHQKITVEILNEIGTQFQRYLGVFAVTNFAIGLLTWGVFAAIGVEHAAIWGVAAALLHIIPYLGPAVIALLAALVTSAQFNSISQGLLVASASVCITVLIGMVLTTWLASRASHMNSAAVFVGLMLWGWLWGIPGLLLGTPLMMATKVVADRIPHLNWLGTFLGEAEKRERRKTVYEESSTADPALTASTLAGELTPLAHEVIAADASIEMPQTPPRSNTKTDRTNTSDTPMAGSAIA